MRAHAIVGKPHLNPRVCWGNIKIAMEAPRFRAKERPNAMWTKSHPLNPKLKQTTQDKIRPPDILLHGDAYFRSENPIPKTPRVAAEIQNPLNTQWAKSKASDSQRKPEFHTYSCTGTRISAPPACISQTAARRISPSCGS